VTKKPAGPRPEIYTREWFELDRAKHYAELHARCDAQSTHDERRRTRRRAGRPDHEDTFGRELANRALFRLRSVP